MGLTIHYKLIAPAGTDRAGAREIVRQLRRRAQGFERRGRVDGVSSIGDDPRSLRSARWWIFRDDPAGGNGSSHAEVLPLEGFMFPINVGKDCEPFWLGLCRYPLTVLLGGRRTRTRLNGWRLHAFCKTQYASLHGWDDFRRCHTAVIDLLAGAPSSGLKVEIDDEGEYWPRRSLTALRRNLDEMNGVVAAAAGALKDFDEAAGQPGRVQSPIFAHKQFERLEAEGASRVGLAITRLIKAARKA